MPTIEEIRDTAITLGQQYGVEKIFLFGSYARGDNNESSDIDFRIDKGNIRGLFQLCGFKNKLEDLLGKEVDVLTTQSLDKDFLNHIAREEILLMNSSISTQYLIICSSIERSRSPICI